MKKADGIFLESCRETAKLFPSIEYEEIIVDNCMMQVSILKMLCPNEVQWWSQLVSKPQRFDVMVTPNFYGSLVSNGTIADKYDASTQADRLHSRRWS